MHSGINGDMLREVSTDCAELGRRKKADGETGDKWRKAGEKNSKGHQATVL